MKDNKIERENLCIEHVSYEFNFSTTATITIINRMCCSFPIFQRELGNSLFEVFKLNEHNILSFIQAHNFSICTYGNEFGRELKLSKTQRMIFDEQTKKKIKKIFSENFVACLCNTPVKFNYIKTKSMNQVKINQVELDVCNTSNRCCNDDTQ